MAKIYKEEESKVMMLDMEVGDKLITKSRPLSKTDLYLNLMVLGIYHPMFYNVETAKEKGWKDTIFQGVIVMNIAEGLLHQSGVIANSSACLGSDKVKFTAPVFPGDDIRYELEIVSKRQRENKDWVVTFKFEIKTQNDEIAIDGLNTLLFTAS
ncbi:MAG TPA: MaoC/PaaZ C-terminal domain-containing protein [Desulfatiglandales bacterium]|nr:MaoC/PaaZ C-terminal domain-containing protein [Desulfatiglandales bacterium]